MNLSTMNRTTANSIFCSGVTNGTKDRHFFRLYPQASLTVSSAAAKSEEELDSLEEVDILHGTQKPEKLDFEHRFRATDSEGGSLPSSPGTPPDCGKAPVFPNERLSRETRELIGDFCRTFCGLPSSGSRSRALPVLQRVVGGVIEKHRMAYNGMINKLQMEERGDDTSFVTSVAKEIFSDKVTNWGRIACLLAFGGVVCRYLKEHGQAHCVDDVSDKICSYLLTDQQDWLSRNNGWEGFVSFFHMEDPESAVRSVLVAFAGVASVGVTLAYFIR